MPRKKQTESDAHVAAGRPAKNPMEKVGTPVRALVTVPVADALVGASKCHEIPEPPYGKVASDIVRLYVFRGLTSDGLMTPELLEDPTWKSLRERGLV